MKKFMMLFALGLLFASCGGAPSACDCAKAVTDADLAAECVEHAASLEGEEALAWGKEMGECMMK